MKPPTMCCKTHPTPNLILSPIHLCGKPFLFSWLRHQDPTLRHGLTFTFRTCRGHVKDVLGM